MLALDARAARVTWTVLLIIGGIALLYELRGVIFLLLLSIFFAYLLIPVIQLADRLRPQSVPRNLTLVVVYLSVLSVIGLGLTAIGSRVAEQAVALQAQLPALQSYADRYLSGDLASMPPVQRAIVEFLRNQLAASGETIVPALRDFGMKVMGAVGGALVYLLVPIFSFFFLLEGPELRESLLANLPARGSLFARTVIDDIDVFLGAYIRALLTLALATFLLGFAVFTLLGVPYALLLAAIGACLEVIPVIGPLISAVTALAVAAFSGYGHLPWLLIYFVALRIIQDYVLQPRVFAQGVKLNPLLILIGVFCGERIGGIAGIFLSIPVMAVLKILLARLRVYEGSRTPA